MDFARELIRFMIARKRLWMLPLFVMIVTLGGLLVLTQGTVVAPFIYALF
jgi:hypothetical protein